MIKVLQSLENDQNTFKFDYATCFGCILLLLYPSTNAICEFFIFFTLFLACTFIDFRMNQREVDLSQWKKGEIVTIKIDEMAKGTVYCKELKLRLKRGEIFQNPGQDFAPKKLYQFLVEETIDEELKKSKKSTRFLEIYSTVFSKVILVTLIISTIVNVIKLTNIDWNYENIILFLTRYQIYTIIPLLNIQLPLINFISKSYCNAYILTLFDALQQSKTDFEDQDDVDEFDAAPAPIKEFQLSWRLIVDKITHGFKGMKRFGLVEDLASCTVLCSVDKMGSIARQIPAVDQILVVEVCFYLSVLPTYSILINK
jgi:hypothetical protein